MTARETIEVKALADQLNAHNRQHGGENDTGWNVLYTFVDGEGNPDECAVPMEIDASSIVGALASGNRVLSKAAVEMGWISYEIHTISRREARHA